MRAAPAGLPDRLLPLALSRPAEAFAAATRLLEGQPDPATASVACQVRAIVLRDAGRHDEAIAELRRALRFAEGSGAVERLVDVQATLGVTLGLAGRSTPGLEMLDRAVANSTGVHAGRALTRRGHLLRVLGRYDEALADLRQAIRVLRRGGDPVWEARARMNRFVAYAALGQAARADRDLVVAERLHAATGQDLESAIAVANRADLAFQVGDIPAALGFLDEASARYQALGASRPALAIDRCAVLLAAGLATEAVAATEEALRRHVRAGANGTSTAELLFAAGQAAQAAGQPALAAERAAAARDLFRQQGRPGWQARASFVALQSRYAAGHRGGRLSTQASRLADELDALRAPEAAAAHLFAGRLAADRRPADADRHLARAARFRHRGPTFGHAAGWLAHALRAEARGATAAALVAARRGLAAAGDHQRALAAPELRAHAAGYGVELAALAERHAVRRGDARMLLRWSERWRASALSLPAIRPPDDRELAGELAALRNVVKRLDAAHVADAPTERLDQERRRLEAAIRSRTRRTAGAAQGRADDGDVVAKLVAGLGDHRLVELTALDGLLYAITVVGHRVRMSAVGPVDSAVRELDLARFMLRRLARGRPPPGALAALDAAGHRLQEALLGPAAALVDGAPVVVVPPARLHAVPWALLPALRATPVVVAPSAATWLRAGRLGAPRQQRVVLVVGPGLSGSAEEVRRIGDGYPGAVVLAEGRATAEAVLSALDGAWTAHVAAHGSFRSDNPLFSAVSLDDGPLTVYDLCRLRHAPRRLVLSSCESGVAAPVAADELLGVVSALVPLGLASLLASVVPVNDAAAAPLMVDFHDRLRAGRSFGDALHGVRECVAGDPVAVATALSFVALGR
ncbi:Tetratricopeptide repeat-containing protein [Micromonospora rhizosphaerae]|uniref:Tetratricopeptide repeat-containing protein n=1 Tax=Micromonospora rhizosphaerae TaxID=568872 RepID=A0A1C6SJ90_9ACTN|nr:Tetratricopeptide repeat-containing protein [Micromonospora rhizosphaerae]